MNIAYVPSVGYGGNFRHIKQKVSTVKSPHFDEFSLTTKKHFRLPPIHSLERLRVPFVLSKPAWPHSRSAFRQASLPGPTRRSSASDID